MRRLQSEPSDVVFPMWNQDIETKVWVISRITQSSDDGQPCVIVVVVLGIIPSWCKISSSTCCRLCSFKMTEKSRIKLLKRALTKIWLFFFKVRHISLILNCLKSVRIIIHKIHHLVCIPPGTPVSDTVCKHCPAGHFSTSDSSSDPCQPHRNCSDLGLKTLRWGTSTSDSLCATQDKTATLECSQHHTLCHNGETIYNSAVALGHY